MTYPRFIGESNEVENAATVVTSSSLASGDFSNNNLKDRRQYTLWGASAAGAGWVAFDFGAAKAMKAWGLAGHNLGSSGGTVILTADNVGGVPPYANTIVASFTPDDDRELCDFFASSNYRYWAIGLGAGTLAPQIGVVFLATEYLEFENLVQSPFNPDGLKDYTDEHIGGEGHLLSVNKNFTMREFDINFTNVEPDFIENDFNPFWDVNGRKLFFFSWDYANKLNDVFYGRIINDKLNSPYEHVWRSLPLQFKSLYTGRGGRS